MKDQSDHLDEFGNVLFEYLPDHQKELLRIKGEDCAKVVKREFARSLYAT